jgi:hypothetical protein
LIAFVSKCLGLRINDFVQMFPIHTKSSPH